MKRILGTLLIVISLLVLGIKTTSIAKASQGHDLRQKIFIHYPKPEPGENSPKYTAGSACRVTGSDQVADWLWAGWQMPVTGVAYKINLSTAPLEISPSVEQAISNATDTWTSADKKQIFLKSGLTSIRSAKYDGQNIIAWKSLSASAIAMTYVWYWSDTKELAEVDMIFNRNLSWAVNDPKLGDCGGKLRAYDVQNIATHEFGHWVGLDDLYNNVDSELTMYGYGTLGELKKDTLGVGDVNGVLDVKP